MATEMGRIERMDVRSVWPDEAQDFTPWLADNLPLLGDELELELVEREASVGDFSLDILARDRWSGRPVAIENQLGRSDHQHLGQLLTYAAGHDAGTVVWIASGFREEHRSAVAWLNRGTNEDIELYAVEISVIRIGGSLPAPLFRTVVRPSRRTSRRSQPSTDHEWYREFFQPLLDQLQEAGWQWSRRWGRREHYFKSGFDHIHLGVYFSGESNAQVLYWIQFPEGETTDRVFDALYGYAGLINEELGLPNDSPDGVWWDPRGNRRYALVTLTRDWWEAHGEAAHDEIRGWMAEYLEKFHRVFTPRLEDVGEETGVWNE